MRRFKRLLLGLVTLPTLVSAQYYASDEDAVKYRAQAQARIAAGDFRTFSYPVTVVYNPGEWEMTFTRALDDGCKPMTIDYVPSTRYKRYYCAGREVARDIDPSNPAVKALPPLPGSASAVRLSSDEFHVRWFVAEELAKRGVTVRRGNFPTGPQIALVWATQYKQAHPNAAAFEQSGMLSQSGTTVSVGYRNLYKDSYTFQVDDGSPPRCAKLTVSSVRCQYRIALVHDLTDVRLNLVKALGAVMAGNQGRAPAQAASPPPAYVARSDVFVWSGGMWSAPGMMPGLRKLALDLDRIRGGGGSGSSQPPTFDQEQRQICNSAAFANMFNTLGAKPLRPPGCP